MSASISAMMASGFGRRVCANESVEVRTRASAMYDFMYFPFCGEVFMKKRINAKSCAMFEHCKTYLLALFELQQNSDDVLRVVE
jgi:hypothetical protein